MVSEAVMGPGYVILNVIRVLNIIALCMVVVASGVMLKPVNTTKKFFFFDAASHFITAIVSLFLVTSELPVFPNFFAKNWPLLSNNAGFSALGLSMLTIGITVLGNLNKEASSQENLGMPFWRIVISAGILVFIMGFINFIVTFIFCDRKTRVTARLVRLHGAQAINHAPMKEDSASVVSGPASVASYRTADYSTNSRTALNKKTFISRPMNPRTEGGGLFGEVDRGSELSAPSPAYQPYASEKV